MLRNYDTRNVSNYVTQPCSQLLQLHRLAQVQRVGSNCSSALTSPYITHVARIDHRLITNTRENACSLRPRRCLLTAGDTSLRLSATCRHACTGYKQRLCI